MPSTFLALGSNIDPLHHLREATRILRDRWPGILFSSVYRTAAVGHEQQEDFFNAVARVETDDAPEAILTELQRIEQSLGKHVGFRWGPRTIDLDLLLMNDLILPGKEGWKNPQPATCNPQLILPHPRMHERRFVLEPLCELMDPGARHPVLGKTWGELLEAVEEQRCERMAREVSSL